MFKRLRKLFGAAPEKDPFDPVYGLPKSAVEEWLARNPGLRQNYEQELKKLQLRV